MQRRTRCSLNRMLETPWRPLNAPTRLLIIKVSDSVPRMRFFCFLGTTAGDQLKVCRGQTTTSDRRIHALLLSVGTIFAPRWTCVDVRPFISSGGSSHIIIIVDMQTNHLWMSLGPSRDENNHRVYLFTRTSVKVQKEWKTVNLGVTRPGKCDGGGWTATTVQL